MFMIVFLNLFWKESSLLRVIAVEFDVDSKDVNNYDCGAVENSPRLGEKP